MTYSSVPQLFEETPLYGALLQTAGEEIRVKSTVLSQEVTRSCAVGLCGLVQAVALVKEFAHWALYARNCIVKGRFYGAVLIKGVGGVGLHTAEAALWRNI